MSAAVIKKQNFLLKNIGINPKRGEYAGIELLRFLLAIIVVTHHFFWKRYVNYDDSSYLGMFCPVACFAMISGFFSAKNLDFKKQAIKSLYLLIYIIVCIFIIYIMSLIIYFAASNSYQREEAYNIVVFKSGLGSKSSFSQWWFLITLIPLCLLSPIIGRFMINLNKHFVLFFILVFVILQNTAFFMPNIIWNYDTFNLIGMFTILLGFMLGIWIKLNVDMHSKKILIFSLITVIPLCVALYALRIWVIVPNINYPTDESYKIIFAIKIFMKTISPNFGILDALLCFLLMVIFINIRVKNRFIITVFLWLGQMAFIIYLYHEFFDFTLDAELLRHMKIDKTVPYWDPKKFTFSQIGSYFAFIGTTVGLCFVLMPLTNILTKLLHTWALSVPKVGGIKGGSSNTPLSAE